MKITITKEEIFAAEQALNLLSQKTLKKKLAYAIAKTARVVGAEAKDLRFAQRMPDTPEVQEYEKRRKALAAEHSYKDGDGNPIMIQGRYQIQDHDGFDKKLTALRNEMPETWALLEAHQKELDELLKEDVELEVHAIQFDMLPKEIEPAALGPLVEAIMGFDEAEDDDEEDEPEEEEKPAKKKRRGKKK
jgi:hypothetical protein